MIFNNNLRLSIKSLHTYIYQYEFDYLNVGFLKNRGKARDCLFYGEMQRFFL
jgi:hypothetical protein